MPSSRYTPSSYGDIDSGGWDNPLPRPHKCKRYPPGDPRWSFINLPPSSDPDHPGSWGHDMCQFCGYVKESRSISDSAPNPQNDHHHGQPRGRGQLRAPSIENDNWAPAPARQEPVRIEPPKSTNGDDWGPTPQAPASTNNDDGGDWGVPAPAAPVRSINNSNGNGNLHSSIPSRSQYRSPSRYDDEEDIEDDGIIPPPSSDPVLGAYVPWTGVT